MNLIVGTAGHIDHGKTALIKALTGTDTDRLPEEKQRGITIDLGFAELDLGDLKIGFVDVPGHERFVRNMLAGASGIDVVLLIVAANEGVMPQTREHFEICRLLDTAAGIIVITKCDLVDEELLDLAKLDVAELVENSFLQNAPVITVSSKTRGGIDELVNSISQVAQEISPRVRITTARLPIDRSFTVKGFGSVVTGTLASGEIGAGQELDLWPSGKRVRVRGVQTQNRAVDKAFAGQRTALNLGSVDHSEISRGMVLSEPDALIPTQIIDASVEVVSGAKRPLRSRQRVRFHIGAAEVLARVHVLKSKGEITPGENGYVQFRLESPVVAVPGERFIVRSYSPQTTIAGGEVLDAQAQKHRPRELTNTVDFLERLKQEGKRPLDLCRLFIEAAGESGVGFRDLRAKTGYTSEVVEQVLGDLSRTEIIMRTETHFIATEAYASLKKRTIDFIESRHAKDPVAGGVSREATREHIFKFAAPDLFNSVIATLQAESRIVAEREIIRSAKHTAEFSDSQKQVLNQLRYIYRADNYEVPKLDEALTAAAQATGIDAGQARKLFQIMLSSNEVVKITGELYFSRAAIDSLISKTRGFVSQSSDRLIDVSSFKELAGISRKYAIPLLEYFDREKVTMRLGDKRKVN